MDFSGKTAIVAASSQGLGKAIAEALAQGGANVMISGRHEEKLRKVKEEIGKDAPGDVSYCAADLTKGEDIERLVKRTVEKYGTVDILVNNSGGPKAGSFEEFGDEDWQHAFELNLLSYIRLIRAALPYLKKRGGKIINIASSSVKEPIPGLILSNTFRTGIIGLAKTLSFELAPYGILVNTVCPGRILTDRIRQLDRIHAEKAGVSEDEVRKQQESGIPLKRYGTPEEFAKVVAFLASDENTYMTGSTLFVDGGAVKSI